MSESTERDIEIFAEALAREGGERTAFLAAACGGDEALRLRVEALLRAHGDAAGFMEEPLPVGGAPVLDAAVEGAGDRIGRYRLLQQIGEGGCGVVFMAEQETPVRRRVALKVVKPGMDSKSVIARFEAERQALALMDHPNIARVFDAGTTEQGRPFFVMELVRGLKITDYCDQNALPMEARLELFVQVCHAVEHAHQKGIIHRDLKPSNVLVTTTTEGLPQPKVIDFGIAKAVSGQTLTDKTLFTAFEMLIGTPAYMSPEQAELTSVDVDTRSDIYSLGVLLYELVTGRTPFDACDLLKRGLDEVRRVIRQQEPVRPSTKLGTLVAADLTAVATSRKAEPLKLIRSVRGDLDWIVLKTLEKNRARRYQTASALAADIRHHLAHETVGARPPSAAYRLQTVLRRHRLLFAGIGALVAVLVGGLVAATYLLARENDARRDADAARILAEANQKTAQTEAAKSRQVTLFLKEMLEGAGPSVSLGRDTTLLKEILDRTADRVDRELLDQPAVVAEVKGVLGRIYQEIGYTKPAITLHREALALSRTISGTESLETASALYDLSTSLFRSSDFTEAEALARECLAMRRRLLGGDHLEVAGVQKRLFEILWNVGKFSEAEAVNDQVLAIERSRLGTNDLALAESLDFQARALRRANRFDEAEKAGREALAIRRAGLPEGHPLVANSMMGLGITLGSAGRHAEAVPILRETAEFQRRVLGPEHPQISVTFGFMGRFLRDQGNDAEAETAFRQSYSILLAEDVLTRNLFVLAEDLVGMLKKRGARPEAESVIRAVLEKSRRLKGPERPEMASLIHSLGDIQATEGRFEAAFDNFGRALAIRQSLLGVGDPASVDSFRQRIRVLRLWGRTNEIEGAFSEQLPAASLGQPERAGYLLVRADRFGLEERWKEAAADAGVALAGLPEDHLAYHSLAPLLVITGDRDGYRDLCAKIVVRFGLAADAQVSERMAKDCLILPDPRIDLSAVAAMADRALKVGPGNAAIPHFQLCKALSEYRRGHFSVAAEWAEKAVQGGLLIPKAQGYAVLAMARHRLGDRTGAAESFRQGTALVAERMPRPDSAGIGGEWRDWIIIRTLLAEAKTVLGTETTNPGDNAGR